MTIHTGWALALMMLSAVANELILDALLLCMVFGGLGRTDVFVWVLIGLTSLTLYAQGHWFRKNAGLKL